MTIPTLSLAGCGNGGPMDTYMRGRVIAIENEDHEQFGGIDRSVQKAHIRILDGNDAGKEVTVENAVLNDREDMRLHQNEEVVLSSMATASGEEKYIIREKYRYSAIVILFVIFIGLTIILGGKTGVSALVGLLVSIAIIMFFIIPRIVAGDSPLAISLIGSFAIACSSLYLAHGFNKRTSIAFLSTVITLALSTFLAVAFVKFGKLFGLGTEESVYLQLGSTENINLQGLLLGGIVLGALGVLDDVTTAQTASIDEISKANPQLGFAELYAAGTSVGREHIASLINTLALAYVGASLPLLLLFNVDNQTPAWVTVNSEYLAEEIVRTLVGSSTLLLAVPISTFFAAKFFQYGRHSSSKRPAACGHNH